VDWTGRRFEVDVGPVAHGGHCVARADGRVIFVRHALPGERVVAEVTQDHGGSFCRADATDVLRASADRVAPPCPLARPSGCGGCDWQHAAAGAQRELKARVVAEALRRIAGIDMPVEVEELPGVRRGLLEWRTRVRLVVDADGRPGLRKHRSHTVMAVAACPIVVAGALDGVLDRRWPPGAELEVVADGAGEVHVVELRGGHKPRRVAGSGTAHEHAAGRPWRLATHGFWQVHPGAAEVLAEVVGQWADAPAAGTAWDLYGGVGLFASVLGEQVGSDGSVLVVESSRRAVADGEANLADLPQVRFQVGKVEDVLGSTELARHRPDVVVLDPPRRGAGRAVIDALAGAGPDRVVYVACDPAALGRDIGSLAAHGYQLAGLRAFDAFPMTHHVECVALLTR
jgi:tRNA/tmRNA/rRNA uracil-C5-methylase (TrmA/RlmC/RlmD family)